MIFPNSLNDKDFNLKVWIKWDNLDQKTRPCNSYKNNFNQSILHIIADNNIVRSTLHFLSFLLSSNM